MDKELKEKFETLERKLVTLQNENKELRKTVGFINKRTQLIFDGLSALMAKFGIEIKF